MNRDFGDDVFALSALSGTRRPRKTDQERAVDLIDMTAVKRALLGNPTALTRLEKGHAIALCDGFGLDREITARGLGLTHSAVDVAIKRARDAAPAQLQAVLEVGAIEAAPEVVDAVSRRDADQVSDLLGELDVLQLRALVVVLADMAGATGEVAA